MMDKVIRGAISAALAMVVVAAPAKASCWSGEQVAAAKVRDMETMLMVSALRCRAGGGSLLARYNKFVVQSRSALVEVNGQLRGHFIRAVGVSRADDAYDRFVTATANRYGAGAAGLDCADMDAIVEAALAEGNSFMNLAALAERAGVAPVIEGGTCPVTLAVAR